MRLLIVLPKQQDATGNFITARRLQHELKKLGLIVELLPIATNEAATLTEAIDRFHPDQLILLHAWRTGQPWLNSSPSHPCPATILLTGTDINHDIYDPEKGLTIEKVLNKAAAIVCQNRLTDDMLRSQHPPWIDRLHYIPPGVLLGKTPFHLRQKHKINPDCRLFLHPAGIRPVKSNLELLKLCDQLAADRPDFAIVFCGPALDQDYFKTFISAIDQRKWAHYLGVIPPSAMPSAMAEADLILNHSISEGMSNALLEAVAVGRPVLARNNPGNAAILDTGKQILLYDTDQDFIALAQQFLITPSKSKTSVETPHTLFSATVEAQNFTTLFNSLS
jgi:glycosyltransferase involved in cell wall biosynthesis